VRSIFFNIFNIQEEERPESQRPTTKAAHRYGVFGSFETDVVTETHGFAIESHSWP